MSVAQPRGHRVSPCPKSSPGALTGVSEQSRLLDRWAVFDIIKEGHEHLGIKERELSVLYAHLSVLPKGKLNPAGLNISYMKVSNVRKRANCMGEMRFRRGEQRLEKAGLIIRKTSANWRRFPIRKGDKVNDACGVDLGPLLLRIWEISRKNEEMYLINQEARSMRTRISNTLQMIRRAASMAEGHLMDQIDAFTRKVRNALRRASVTVEDLQLIEVSVTDFGDMIERSTAVDDQVLSDENAVDDGHSVRHIESPKKEDINICDADRNNDVRSLGDVWNDVDQIRALFPDEPKTERELVKVIFDYSRCLQLRKETVLTAIVALGYGGTLLSLNYLAKKGDDIKKPVAYFISMVKRYQAGEAIAGGQIKPPKSSPLPAYMLAR
jgi:replication initiation protein RepC